MGEFNMKCARFCAQTWEQKTKQNMTGDDIDYAESLTGRGLTGFNGIGCNRRNIISRL